MIKKIVADQLSAFAKSSDYQHKGWFNLSAAISILASLAVCFGLVLIIATNWYMFSDLIKITCFLILMGGVHCLGLYIAKKGYEKLSSALHFLGAGLFIAGIGLMAQIFNLVSQKGDAFLIWAAMIAPVAILLRNGPIALLSLVAFTIWGNVYIDYLFSYSVYVKSIFNGSVFVSAALVGLLMKQKGSPMSSYIKIYGIIGSVTWLYLSGFNYKLGASLLSGKEALFFILMLIPALVLGLYLWSKNRRYKESYYILISSGFVFFTLIFSIIITSINFEERSYFEYFSFGFTRKIYILPFMLSISAWVGYFGLALWGVIYGALHQKRWMLNCNIFLIGLGIFTRFIDIVGSMMNTGIIFIVSGIVFLVAGFFLERWRRKLIAQSKVKAVV